MWDRGRSGEKVRRNRIRTVVYRGCTDRGGSGSGWSVHVRFLFPSIFETERQISPESLRTSILYDLQSFLRLTQTRRFTVLVRRDPNTKDGPVFKLYWTRSMCGTEARSGETFCSVG